MPELSLRFSIREGDHRAATWKLWTNARVGKSDIYLACRELGGDLKASLHESGQWHTAFFPKTFSEKVQGAIPSLSDRFMEKWSRPQDLSPGVGLAFRIVTPWSAVITPIEGERAGIIWLPNSPRGKATEVAIFLLALGAQNWPGKNSMKTSLVGSFQLDSGESVCAVYHVVDMPDLSHLSRARGHFFKGKSHSDLERGQLRAMAFGRESDGSRTFYDLPS